MAAFFEPARCSVIPNITAREDGFSRTPFLRHLVREPAGGRVLGGVVAAFWDATPCSC